MEKPFFSIIVVAYNAAAYIRKTIESVLSQSFQGFEIVVKDAASTDATLAEIPKDDRIRVYSEKDSGIYDGMNAAIGYARGKYIQFLNCGDILADKEVLADIYNAIKAKRADVIYGDIRKHGKRDRQLRRATRRSLAYSTICHQALFFNSDVFSTVGTYNTEYKLCADREHILRMHNAGCSFRFLRRIVCEYLGDGASESAQNARRMHDENKKIENEFFTEKERRRIECKRTRRRLIKKLLRRG